MKYLLAVIVAFVLGAGIVYVIKNEDTLTREEQRTVTRDIGSDVVSGNEDNAPKNDSQGSVLDVSNQGLTKVPNSVFDITNLTTLNLSQNKLSGALQAEVRLLRNLRELDLSDNNFTGVPAEVGQLSNLEVLDLSNNPLTGLPSEIGNLKNLKILDLRGTNYSVQDLEGIRKSLPQSVVIKVD